MPKTGLDRSRLNSMAKLGMFTDPHGVELAGSMKRVFDQQGIAEDARVCLGDGVYHTLTSYTAHRARIAIQARRQLLKNTALQERIMEGEYSDEQLEQVIVNPYKEGEEVADAVAKAIYSDWKGTFPEAVWLGGNHDRRVAKEILGENLLEERLVDLAGIPVLGLTGGGTPPIPNSFFGGGLYADDPEEEKYHHKNWAKPVIDQVASGRTQTIFSHVPPKMKDDAEHIDVAERHLQDIIEAAWEKRKTNSPLSDEQKEQPLTVFWGHKHAPTTVEFVTYDSGAEILSVTPGMSGYNHNDGSYASFVVTEFDDTSKQLKSVHEYRIYTFLDQREIVLYGTHTIDWENKEVEFEKTEHVVASEEISAIDTHLTLDKHYFLKEECFTVSYEGLSPAAKNTLLLKKLAAADDYAHDVVMKARDVLNKARRSLVCGREAEAHIPDEEVQEAMSQVHRELAGVAASYFGLDLSTLSEDSAHDLYRNIVIHAAMGLEAGSLYRSLLADDLTAGKVSEWGESLLGDLRKSTRGTYQMLAIQELEAKDFQEMAEAYQPLSVERTRWMLPYEKQDGINLWVKAWNGGLLPAEDMTSTGCYQKKEEYAANPKTKEQLMEMLGVESLSEEAPDEAAQERAQQMEQFQETMELDRLMRKRGMGITDEHGNFHPGMWLERYLGGNPERNPMERPEREYLPSAEETPAGTTRPIIPEFE